MSTATMTSKGQITIPAVVRAALGVAAGDRVEFDIKLASFAREVVQSQLPRRHPRGLA